VVDVNVPARDDKVALYYSMVTLAGCQVQRRPVVLSPRQSPCLSKIASYDAASVTCPALHPGPSPQKRVPLSHHSNSSQVSNLMNPVTGVRDQMKRMGRARR